MFAIFDHSGHFIKPRLAFRALGLVVLTLTLANMMPWLVDFLRRAIMMDTNGRPYLGRLSLPQLAAQQLLGDQMNKDLPQAMLLVGGTLVGLSLFRLWPSQWVYSRSPGASNMNDATWFRLLLRAIGIVLVGFAAPTIVSYCGSIASMFVDRGRWGGGRLSGVSISEMLYMFLPSASGHLMMLGLGVFLFIAPRRFVRWCVNDTVGRCGMCGYDLRGLTNNTKCTECGTPFNPELVRAAAATASNADAHADEARRS